MGVTARICLLTVSLLRVCKAASQLDLMWKKQAFREYRQRPLYCLSNVKGTGVLAPAPRARSLLFRLLLGRTSQWKRESCTARIELWNNLTIAFCGLREQHQSQKHHSTSVSSAVSGRHSSLLAFWQSRVGPGTSLPFSRTTSFSAEAVV